MRKKLKYNICDAFRNPKTLSSSTQDAVLVLYSVKESVCVFLKTSRQDEIRIFSFEMERVRLM